MACTFYIIRHGTTEWNKQGRWQGEKDTELAPEGIQEAQTAAAAFVESGVSFSAVYCSDLKRAHLTAQILSGPSDIEPQPRAELRECSLGEFEVRAGLGVRL